MPKVFLTGSGTSKGFLTGSGFINNPLRTVIRDRDNQLNTYPRSRYLNDPKFSFAASAFNDNNTIVYGKKIHDDFNMSANIPGEMTKKVNLSKWVVSDEDTVIVRKEDLNSLSDLIPSQPAPGALVLGGSTRWVRTAKKVKNPSLRFKVIVGPYAFDDINAINLFSPRNAQTNTLKVQISSDAASWEDVDIETRNISIPGVNVFDGGLDPTSPIRSVGLGGGPNAPNNIGGNIKYLKFNADGVRKPEYEVNINRDQLSLTSDTTASFYIRIIQETVSNNSEPIWAISEIEIISREQTLIGQTGLQRNNTHGLTSSMSSPNFLSNLQVENAISLPHQSDNNFTRSDLNPEVDAFKDDQHVADTSREFYQYGISPKLYSGFDSSLLEKNKVEIDISSAINGTAGYINKSTTTTNPSLTTGDQVPVFADFMVYYNKTLKRWEPVGRGTPHSLVPTLQSDDSTPNSFGVYSPSDFIASSSIGFSTSQVPVSTGSLAASGQQFFRPEVLNTACRPVKTFGFPVAAKYHATGSQLFQMSDYISRPFLIEKVVWEVDANLKSPGTSNDSTNGEARGFGSYHLIRSYDSGIGSAVAIETTRRLQMRIHTFFMCRQSKGESEVMEVPYYGHIGFNHTDNDQKSIARKTHTFTSHGKVAHDGNLNYFQVNDNRELITYSQVTEYARKSTVDTLQGGLSYDNLIRTKLTRDGIVKIDNATQSSGYDVQRTLVAEAPVRLSGKITDVYSTLGIKNVTPGHNIDEWSFNTSQHQPGHANPSTIHFGDDKGGRTTGKLDDASRTVVNAFPSSPGNVESVQPPAQSSFANITVQVPDGNIDKHSPYILFPEDEIFIGYQYPLPRSLNDAAPGSNASVLQQAIFNGEGRLILYGSEIKDNKEYHGGLNQNLTSNAIHTVIADEPVTDQFQVATRGELTGSYADDFPINLDNRKGGSIIYGKLLTTFESDTNIIDLGTQRAWTQYSLVPSNRIPVPIYSIVALDSFGLNVTAKSYVNQSGFNFNLVDLSRTFLDSKYKLTSNYYFATDSSVLPLITPEYGSAQNIVANNDGSDPARLGGSPKYYFSGKHFGHYADIVRQGLDGAFVDDPTTSEDNIFTEPPVKIRFAEGIFNSETRTRQFQRVNIERIPNSAEREFQSSNLSLNATSSIAFKDDNVARNRVYGTFEIVT